MDDDVFAATTRRAPNSTTRRGSLAMLGGAVLAAAAGPLATQARRGNGGNGSGKKANTRCKRQVAGCAASVRAICGDTPDCDAAVSCCSSLGACNANGFFACVVALSDDD